MHNVKKGGFIINHFKKILFKLQLYRHINEKHLADNHAMSCRDKNAVYLIAVIIIALFCLGGCSNENQTEQLTTKPPLTEEAIEQTLQKYNNNWKRYDLNIDDETASQVITNLYGFDDGDGLRLMIQTYKKEGATYLNISFSPLRYIGGEEPEFIKEKLPDIFAAACELYEDEIDLKEFEDFWDFYESREGLMWTKAVGDNIIYVQLHKDDIMNFTTVSSVSIAKKSWVDQSKIETVKFMLWGNQDVSIEEHISTVDDIIKNKAVSIKSCFILNGDIFDIKKFDKMTNLPDEKELFSKLHRSHLVPEANEYGEYNVATIEDSSGKLEVIIPPFQIPESDFKEFKYFAIYEYNTDKGRTFYLLDMTRSLNDMPT